MRSRIGVGVATILVLELAQGAVNQPRKALASQPTKQRLLYQTNWRHGTLGWRSSSGGWNASNGTLYTTSDLMGTLIAPYQIPGSVGSFAVVAIIKADRAGEQYYSRGFGVVARSVFAGIMQICCNNEKPVLAGIKIGTFSAAPLGNDPAAASNFDPGNGWHIYRLEVRGNQYTLLVDGAVAARTTSNSALASRKVGLFATKHETEIRVFKVFAL